MGPVDVRAIALFHLVVGAVIGYSLHKRRIEEKTSAKEKKVSASTSASTTGSAAEEEKSIRLVVQRFRKASLLVKESETVAVEKPGIIVYASFAKSANKEKVLQAARTIMNLPMLTHGVWGDGSDPVSLLDLEKRGGGVSIILVPQANLISKVRSQGRSIQYHGQISKESGKALYEHFVDCVKAIALQHQYASKGEPVPKELSEFGKPPSVVDASVPPKEMFRNPSLYSAWDEQGIPQCNQDGVQLTKSALKKLRKLYQSQEKRYEKFLKSAQSNVTPRTTSDFSALDASILQVVSGTFGKRQGLEMSSDMGPFCHVLNL